MATSDPFDFDISVTSDKAKKKRGRVKRGMSGSFETSTRLCEHPGCGEQGQYRAPKSPDQLDEYLWFCWNRARAYNLKWNFFDGAAEEKSQEQADEDRIWGRDTKPFGKKGDEQRAWARLGIDDPHQVLGVKATRNPGDRSATDARRLPPTERKALDILDAGDCRTKSGIRNAYKALIKILHPDMNGGDRSHEEQLQEVVWAWDQIKDSPNFRD